MSGHAKGEGRAKTTLKDGKKEKESLSNGRFESVGIDRRLCNLIQFDFQSKWPVIELNESAALMDSVE